MKVLRRLCRAAALLLSVAIPYRTIAQAVNDRWAVGDDVNLRPTIVSARENNPPCLAGKVVSTAVVRDKLKTKMDTAIGRRAFSVAAFPEAGWLNGGGVNVGASSCAELCAIVPAAARTKICAADNKFGRGCFRPGDPGSPDGGDGPLPYSHTMLLGESSRSDSGKSEIVCALVKSWSSDLNRDFTLEWSASP